MDVKKIRRGALVGVTSLALAYVRNGIETHWKGWNSWEDFGASWFIHWLALVLFAGLAAALIKSKITWFLGSEEDKIPDLSDLVIYIVLAVLVALVAIWFLAHWVPRGDDGYSDW